MKRWVQLTLFFLDVLCGVGFWFFLNQSPSSAFGLIPTGAIIDLVFFVTFLGLSLIFLRPEIFALSILLSFSPVFLFLENKLLAISIILGTSLLSLFPVRRVKKEIESRLILSVKDILRVGLPKLLTIFAISLAAFFYPIEGIKTVGDILPESLFENVLSFANSTTVKNILPFSIPDPNKTVDEVLIDALRLDSGITYSSLTKSEQERILSQARASLAKSLGAGNVEGKSKIGKILYRESIKIVEERIGGYKKYLPAVFAITIFAAFRTLFIFIELLSVAICWIVFKILLYLEIIKISTRQVSQEYIEIK